MMRFSCYATMAAIGQASADGMQFLVMGDWGGAPKSPYTTKYEVGTAKSMDAAAKSLGAKFALALGDNFYTKGVTSVDDKRFEETFEQCFTGSALQAASGFDFHLIAGNHDHIGDANAQVEYSAKSKRWNFPSLWYDFKKTAPDGATVHFVMIDTPTLAGNSQWNDDDIDSLPGDQLPGPPDAEAAQSQLDFIKTTLASSTADYLIVAGHYPVFSVAEHGPTKQLQPSVFPYLRQYNVSAYLCGHEHSEEYIDVGDGIQYHVIGSAHEGNPSTAHAKTLKPGQLKFHSIKGGGFATVEVSKSGMQIKHVDENGALLFAAPPMLPRGSGPSPTPPVPPSPPSPSPSPPAPAGHWECHSNQQAKVGTDQDLKATGADITSCEKRCLDTDTCKAVMWHKSDSHCHIFTGSYSHDDFVSSLSKSKSHDSCYFVTNSDALIV